MGILTIVNICAINMTRGIIRVDKQMFPGEMVILMATTLPEDWGERLLMRPMDIASEYIGYLYDSLVVRGFLMKNGYGKYSLTAKGSKALLWFMHEDKAGVKDAIATLQQLDIGAGRKMDKVEKEVVGVK